MVPRWSTCGVWKQPKGLTARAEPREAELGQKSAMFRSIYTGGKFLPDLARNNVLSLHLFVSLLPLVKLSEPLNLRQRRSVWFSHSCSKGSAIGPGSCVPTTSPIRGVPRALWEWALLPRGRSWGFGSSVGSPSQSIPRLYSLMYYLLTRWRPGQWGRGGWGGKEAAGTLLAVPGQCFESIALPPPGPGGAWPQQNVSPHPWEL